MKIKLIGMASCSRCKMAKMMLEKRNLPFEYKEVTIEESDNFDDDLPLMIIDEDKFYGKEAMLQIRKMGDGFGEKTK